MQILLLLEVCWIIFHDEHSELLKCLVVLVAIPFIASAMVR